MSGEPPPRGRKLAANRRSVDQETGFKPSKLVLVLPVMVFWRVFTRWVFKTKTVTPFPGVWTQFPALKKLAGAPVTVPARWDSLNHPDGRAAIQVCLGL